MELKKKGDCDMQTLKLENIGASKSWIAEITGKDAKFGLKREFLNGVRDYSRANSVNPHMGRCNSKNQRLPD